MECSLCGHKGVYVQKIGVYIGGQGMVTRAECIDRVACWKRIDRVTPGNRRLLAAVKGEKK